MSPNKKQTNRASKNSDNIQLESEEKPPSILLVLLANLLVLAFFFILLFTLPLPSLFACTDPRAQSFLFAISSIFMLHFFSSAIVAINSGPAAFDVPRLFRLLGTKTFVQNYRVTLSVLVAIILVSFWLGSYTYSPLKISTSQIPVIKGFVVSSLGNDGLSLLPGDVFTVNSTSWASINVVTEPANITCIWSSTSGGSIDDTNRCNIVYFPPLGTNSDLLEVQVSPACQIPESHGHLKVNISP